MAIIDLQGICKNFEAQKILEDAYFVLEKDERVCIVGKNGSGKSTLMKIAAGQLDTDDGKRIIQNGVKIEMLAQEPIFDAGMTVKDAIEAELKELHEAKLEFEAVSAKLGENFDDKTLNERHSYLTNYLDTHSAWDLDDKVERVLLQLVLKQFEHSLVSSLSGGERRRVALAGLLLKKPDVLLLDEPTNHLDVYMVEFLEELLLKERYTILFISHDRYFIDRLATRTIEVEDAKLRSYKGGYADYIAQKEQVLSAMINEHENLLRLLKVEENWLATGISARRKRNEGRKERLMQIRTQAKTNPTLIKKVRLQIEREKKHWSGGSNLNRQKMLFEIESMSYTIGEKKILANFSARILQKDRIAIVGRNGAGKSTLLKLLMGSLVPDAGKVKRGEFAVGYFDQNRDFLDDSKNIMETFCPMGGDRVAVQGRDMHVFGYLKNFLFPKEYLDKNVGILSGGEKNRIALALLFTKKVDLLIMDEPTNDLDIPTINILEEYIQNFTGAVIFVSHDRYFVDKIAEKLFVMKDGGVVEEIYDSYTEYLEDESELREIAEIEAFFSAKPADKPEEPKKERVPTKLSYKEKSEHEKLPCEIEALEEKVKELESCLSNPDCYGERGIAAVAAELDETKAKLEQKVERFLEIEEKLEALAAS